MSYDFGSFAAALMGDPVLALIVVLTLGATVVNGATDAPNAIATVVGTKAMRPGPAIAMAAVCNFVGLAAITMVLVGRGRSPSSRWSTSAATTTPPSSRWRRPWWPSSYGAWRRGTSASPRRRATRSSPASPARPSPCRGAWAGVNGGEWMKVVYGLVISTVLGLRHWVAVHAAHQEGCARRAERAKANSFFKWAQIVSGAGVAVLAWRARRPEVPVAVHAGHHARP